MKKLTAGFCAVAMVLGGSVARDLARPAEVKAQSNDNDYTPLNSRIRRDRQFPTEPRSLFNSRQLGDASSRRSLTMADHFARCLWDRSNEKAFDLLAKTDFGFVDFAQIEIDNSEVGRYYPIQTCLSRVANTNNSGVTLRYNAPSMRRWYMQAAYLDLYEDGPSWIRPGFFIDERSYPLSDSNPAVHAAMDFADCVVAQDPHAADYFFRTGEETEEEATAINHLIPSISACIPQGQELEMDPTTLRVWLGEGLWHASQNSSPPPPEGAE